MMHFLCRYEDPSSNPQNLCKLGHSRAHLQSQWLLLQKLGTGKFLGTHGIRSLAWTAAGEKPYSKQPRRQGWNPRLISDLHMNATARSCHNHREARVYSLEHASANTHLYNNRTHNMQIIVTISAHTIFSASPCVRRQWW